MGKILNLKKKERQIKKFLLGILLVGFVMSPMVPAAAKDIIEKKGDVKIVYFIMVGDPIKIGDVIRFGGFAELNLTQRIRGRIELVNFEKENKRLVPMLSLLYGFYPKKYFSPYLGVGVRLGQGKPGYLQVVIGFSFSHKPMNLFAEVKFLIEDVKKIPEMDIQKSKLQLCIGIRF